MRDATGTDRSFFASKFMKTEVGLVKRLEGFEAINGAVVRRGGMSTSSQQQQQQQQQQRKKATVTNKKSKLGEKNEKQRQQQQNKPAKIKKTSSDNSMKSRPEWRGDVLSSVTSLGIGSIHGVSQRRYDQPVINLQNERKEKKKNNTSIHNENSREKDDLRGYRLRREPSVFLSCFIEF